MPTSTMLGRGCPQHHLEVFPTSYRGDVLWVQGPCACQRCTCCDRAVTVLWCAVVCRAREADPGVRSGAPRRRPARPPPLQGLPAHAAVHARQRYAAGLLCGQAEHGVRVCACQGRTPSTRPQYTLPLHTPSTQSQYMVLSAHLEFVSSCTTCAHASHTPHSECSLFLQGFPTLEVRAWRPHRPLHPSFDPAPPTPRSPRPCCARGVQRAGHAVRRGGAVPGQRRGRHLHGGDALRQVHRDG